MPFDVEVIKVLTELGVGGVALFMFYKMNTKQNDNHREDRKQDSELWRNELKEENKARRNQHEKTDIVLTELTTVIRDLSRKHEV